MKIKQFLLFSFCFFLISFFLHNRVNAQVFIPISAFQQAAKNSAEQANIEAQKSASERNVSATMMTGIAFVYAEMDAVKEQAMQWVVFGKLIGLIGAYIYIARKFVPKMIRGEEFDLTDIFQPFFVAFLLSCYSPVFNGVSYVFGVGAGTEYNKIGKALTTFGDLYIQMNDQEKEDAALASGNTGGKTSAAATDGAAEVNGASSSDQNVLSKIVSGVTTMAKGVNQLIATIIASVLVSSLIIIGMIACALLFLIASCYLLFLYIYGPISIGMSLFPSFENSLPNFFQKIITYSLWFPTGMSIIDLCTSVIGKIATSGSIFSIVSMLFSYIVILPFMIFALYNVPKICNNVLATGGNNSSTRSAMTNALKKMATKGLA